jgi:hypothetical protein
MKKEKSEDPNTKRLKEQARNETNLSDHLQIICKRVCHARHPKGPKPLAELLFLLLLF